MPKITAVQKTNLLAWLENFSKEPGIVNEGLSENYHDFDTKRNAAAGELKKLVDAFLSGQITIIEFKEKSEAACREHPYWGFKGFSGQMQLNQYVNNIPEATKEAHLKTCLQLPADPAAAGKKILDLSKFLADARMKASNPRALPWISQAYLLSYFWELQKPCGLPVYYNSTKKTLNSAGFDLDRFSNPGDEYKEFVEIINEIWALFQSQGFKDEKFPYWFVEHVIWTQFVKMQETVDDTAPVVAPQTARAQTAVSTIIIPPSGMEWVPPIIQDLNDVAYNKETAWTQAKNVRPEKAFETKLRYAFTILGYETTELGQGTGRQPDGVAKSRGVMDGDYAIVYDAKARQDSFSLGTGDREIFEYIQKKKEELRRQRINKCYFVVVSSDFSDPNAMASAIRDTFRRTQVPVSLLKASDLLFIIGAKLQDADMDHARLEELFLDNGLITREKIIDALGLR